MDAQQPRSYTEEAAVRQGDSFGALLKRHRLARGMTQEELAERAKLSTRGLRALEHSERGRPYRVTVALLADALRLSPPHRADFEAIARGAAPAPTFPTGAFLGARPVGPLVGRELQVGRILKLVDTVTAGAGRLGLLSGEPGVGKTRLTQATSEHLHTLGFLVATGRCYEPQQSVPFYPFLDALEAVLAAAPATIRAEAGRRWPYLGHLLPEQLGIRPVLSTGAPEDQQRLYRAVGSFLLAVAEVTPVGLLLDDIHCMDVASLGLFHYVARYTRGHRVLLIATYRDREIRRGHLLERVLLDLDREGLAERIELPPLSQEEMTALVAATVGEKEVGEGFTELVHRRTGGNPFFALQVLRALLEQAEVYRHDGRWTGTAVEELEVPAGVRAMIGHRLARLSGLTPEILHEASVLGQRFTFEDLQGMSEHSDGEVEGALDEAIEVGMVREAGDDCYTFDHALTQDTLYAGLSGRQKRRLHRAAGEAIERLPERQRAARAAELTWHFRTAGELERALHWGIVSGNRAETVYAGVDAERQYRTALELAEKLGDVQREGELRERLGRVLSLTGHYEEAMDLLQRAVEVSRQREDLDSEARIVAQMMVIHGRRETCVAGVTLAESVEERLRDAAPSPGMVAFYTALANLLRSLARFDDELVAAEHAVTLARELGDDLVLARALRGLGFTFCIFGRSDDAQATLEEAIPTFTREGDIQSLGQVYGALGFACQNRGDLRAALRYQRQAVQAAERLGDPASMTTALHEFATASAFAGEWQRARAASERALEAADRTDAASRSTLPVFVLALLNVYEGRFAVAEGYLARLHDLAAMSDAPYPRLCAQWVLLNRDLLQGRAEEAVTRMDPSTVITQLDPWMRALTLPYIAEAHLELEHEALAQEVLYAAFDVARGPGTRAWLLEPMRVRAKLLIYQEHWNEATDQLEELLSLARGGPFPYEEARALYEYGRVHVQRGEPQQARERWKEAWTIFRRLGAQPYLERTERALRGLG